MAGNGVEIGVILALRVLLVSVFRGKYALFCVCAFSRENWVKGNNRNYGNLLNKSRIFVKSRDKVGTKCRQSRDKVQTKWHFQYFREYTAKQGKFHFCVQTSALFVLRARIRNFRQVLFSRGKIGLNWRFLNIANRESY